MGALNFRKAENYRVKLTKEQQRQIQKLYKEVAEDIANQAKKAPRVPSDRLRKVYLDHLEKQINHNLEKIQDEIGGNIESTMHKVAESVADCNLDFLKKVGFPVQGAFSHVPDEVVRTVATGQLYEKGWSLSKALWKTTAKAKHDINTVIAKGIAENKSSFDIAKDLERYVNPSARKGWDWSKVYPGTNKKVDYNAQRLARTMVSHAYQQSFVKTTQKNPFVEDYIWEASNSSRTCELCASRDGQHFKKDDLPLDHPNGMCTFIANMPDDMNSIADRIADWAGGKEDPALDEYARSLHPIEVPKAPKRKPQASSGLTDKQKAMAAAWDSQYNNVVEFAKKTGQPIDECVKNILGAPPKGSIHYGGAPDSVKKEVRHVAPAKKKYTFSGEGSKDMSRDAANDYIKSMAKKQRYGSAVESAIEDYTMFSDDMNAYLRGQVPYNDYADSICTLSRSMSTGSEEILYRGCDSKVFGISPMLSEAEIQNRIIGSSYREMGFLSTSKTSDVAQEFSHRGIDGDDAELPTIITMKAQKSVGKVYVNSGLGEVLLNKNSTIHFTEANLKDGVLHLFAEVD